MTFCLFSVLLLFEAEVLAIYKAFEVAEKFSAEKGGFSCLVTIFVDNLVSEKEKDKNTQNHNCRNVYNKFIQKVTKQTKQCKYQIVRKFVVENAKMVQITGNISTDSSQYLPLFQTLLRSETKN